MKTRPTTPTPNQGKIPPGGDAPPGARKRECLPCEIAPFSRNNYYTGKLLTGRELTAEQRYQIDKLRLHHIGLHGWGVACGLKVVPHPHCPALYLVIEPGLAIDGAGREIYVRSCIQLSLPKPPTTPPGSGDPCPPEYPAPPPPPPSPEGKSEGSSAPEGSPETPPSSPDEPKSCPVRSDLYVLLRYVECETEFTPAPFDECACNGDAEKPNRIVEGYVIDLSRDKPDDWDKIIQAIDVCGVDECADIYGQLLRECPEPCWPAYIPLAVVRDSTPGAAVTAEMIDNRGSRPLLPSTRRLDQLIRCILDKLPTRTTTRIRDFNWTHGHTYQCGDFLRWFVEDHHGPREFEVAFSKPVHTHCLTPRVFQATVVRHERGHEGGGFIEVVPAHVWADEDRSKFFLRIDKHFADRCLRGASFDLYLTLRCDVVLDQWGVPVDGDLLARLEGQTPVVKPPTGDGIPGGTFESWIRVHA